MRQFDLVFTASDENRRPAYIVFVRQRVDFPAPLVEWRSLHFVGNLSPAGGMFGERRHGASPSVSGESER